MTLILIVRPGALGRKHRLRDDERSRRRARTARAKWRCWWRNVRTAATACMVKWRVARDLRCALREKEKRITGKRERYTKRRAERRSCAQAQRHATPRCAAAVTTATVKDVCARFIALRERKCWSETEAELGRPRENRKWQEGRWGKERATEKGEKEKEGDTGVDAKERNSDARFSREFPSLHRAPARSTRRIRASRSRPRVALNTR